MKTSTEIGSAARLLGEERAVELIGRAGFDAWDFSLYNMWKWDKIKDESVFSACATGEDFKKHIDIVNDDFRTVCVQVEDLQIILPFRKFKRVLELISRTHRVRSSAKPVFAVLLYRTVKAHAKVVWHRFRQHFIIKRYLEFPV